MLNCGARWRERSGISSVPLGRELQVTIGHEDWGEPERLCDLWTREISFAPTGNGTLIRVFPSPQAGH